MAAADPEEATRLRSMLRIANTLGVPVEAFYRDDTNARQVAQTNEMLRLWSLMKIEARDDLLKFARAAIKADEN